MRPNLFACSGSRARFAKKKTIWRSTVTASISGFGGNQHQKIHGRTIGTFHETVVALAPMQKANVFRKHVWLTEYKPKLIARMLALPFQACAARLVRRKSPDLFTLIVYSSNARFL